MAATSGSADAGRVAAAVIDSSDATPKQSIEQLKALLPPKEVADLSAQRSDSEGVQQAAFHFGLAAALAWLVVRAGPEWTWARVALMVALAFVESFFFMPLHECVHQSAFRSRWLNDAVALLCGLLTMRPPNHYRLYHYCHHRFTGDKARDPELQNTPIDPDLKTLSGYLLYLSGLPFWYDRTTTLARHASGESGIAQAEFYLQSAAARQQVVAEARFFVVCYASLLVASLALSSRLLWDVWVLPSLIGQAFLRYYLLAEHRGCQEGTDMLSNTRTTLTTVLYRKLAWNMPYHAEHHAFPAVPFHLLPELYRRLNGVSVARTRCVPSGEQGYFNVHRHLVSQMHA